MNTDYNMNEDRFYSTDYKKMIFGNQLKLNKEENFIILWQREIT